MSGFLDHLYDSKASEKRSRDRIRYRETLKTLIQDAPAVRRLPSTDCPYLLEANPISEQILPSIDLYFAEVGESVKAEIFRLWKSRYPQPVYRVDAITTEDQVLETRSMGADAFVLDVTRLDQAMLQFLVEVGADYGLPAILSCQSAEDLALALKIQDTGGLWLREELQSEALFELDILKGRRVLFESLAPLVPKSEWTCGVIRLNAKIALRPRGEKKEIPNEEQETEALDLFHEEDESYSPTEKKEGG